MIRIDGDTHHGGSPLYFMGIPTPAQESKDALIRDRQRAIDEGKHAYDLVWKASETLFFGGVGILVLSSIQLFVTLRKTHNKAKEPTP